MSDHKVALETALAIAETLRERLRPYCHRIEIAGSIRRRKSQVKDIELVAIPVVIPVLDLLGQPFAESLPLEDELRFLEEDGKIRGIKNGQRYKAFKLLDYNIKVDLSLVRPPAQWGVIFALRTGPAAFSKRLVAAQPWGLRPAMYKFKNGALWRNGTIVKTPEEEDLFKALNFRYIKPEER